MTTEPKEPSTQTEPSKQEPSTQTRGRLKGLVHALINAIAAKLIIKSLGLIFLALGGVGGLVTIKACTRVHDYELVMVHRWGALKESPADPGIEFFWPIIDTVHRYDTRQRVILIKEPLKPEDPMGIEARTADGWQIGLVTRVFYTLNKKKGIEIVTAFGSDESPGGRHMIETRIDAEVRHAIQNLVPQYKIEYLTTHRAELEHNVMCSIGFCDDPKQPSGGHVELPTPLRWERLSDVGVEVKTITVELDVPSKYDQMQSEEAAIKKDIVLTTARRELEKERQSVVVEESHTKKLLTESEAEHLRIMLSAKAQYSHALQFLDKWNGVLPDTMVTDRSLVQSFVEGAITGQKK